MGAGKEVMQILGRAFLSKAQVTPHRRRKRQVTLHRNRKRETICGDHQETRIKGKKQKKMKYKWNFKARYVA
jgi:hypothetical protein